MSIVLGILGGLFGGLILSVVCWHIRQALGSRYPYFEAHAYLYFAAVPIEVCLGFIMFQKNKTFVPSFTIAAICISSICGVISIAFGD